MKTLIAVLVAFCFISCNNEKSEDEKYWDSLTPQQKADFDKQEQQRLTDSAKYESFGGLDTLKFDYMITKCNLIKGEFAIRKPIKDSVDLVLISRCKANELYSTPGLDVNCPYKKMIAVYIFESKEAYENNDGAWISMCTITPSHPEGEVSVNTFYISGDTVIYGGERK